MGRTFVRQGSQIRKSDAYDDTITPSSNNYEISPTTLEDDLNTIRSQIQNFLNRNGSSFPTGNWYDYWTGTLVASGPSTHTVSAPLTHLPIFVKEGTILPLYNQNHIETLVKNVQGINDFEYADSTMEFRFYGCGTDQFELWDSTVIQMHRYTGDSLTTVTGGHPRLYSSAYIYDNSVNCFVGISDQIQETNLSAYPNPTTGITTVSIELLLNTESKIEIYNLSGSLVQSEKINITSGDTKKQIDISNLTSGIYLLKVSANNKYKTIKVVKH